MARSLRIRLRAFKDPAVKIQPVFSAEQRHMRLIIDHAVFHLLMLRDIRRIGDEDIYAEASFDEWFEHISDQKIHIGFIRRRILAQRPGSPLR